MPTLKARLKRRQVDMWTAVKAMLVSTGVFVLFVVFAQLQFWANSNARADDKAEEAATKNWDLQLKVTEAEISKLIACVDAVGTRDDFRRFGDNIFDLIDGILVEAQAAADPFLNLAENSRSIFEVDFPPRNLEDCPIPELPVKPEDVPKEYNPPIPTIPDAYVERLEAAGINLPQYEGSRNE